MQKINLTGRVLEAYNRQTQSEMMSAIEREINRTVDGYLFPVMSVTTTYTMNLNDALILCDATGGAFTVTLKPAAECKEKLVIIKKVDNTANVTVDGDGSETIDGATTYSLTTQYQAVRLMSDGTKWHVV